MSLAMPVIGNDRPRAHLTTMTCRPAHLNLKSLLSALRDSSIGITQRDQHDVGQFWRSAGQAILARAAESVSGHWALDRQRRGYNRAAVQPGGSQAGMGFIGAAFLEWGRDLARLDIAFIHRQRRW